MGSDGRNKEGTDHNVNLYLSLLPLEAQKWVIDTALKHDNLDNFISEITIGPCPNCGDEKTMDCGELPSIEDPTCGICLKCGYRWCLECGQQCSDKECEHYVAWSEYCVENSISEYDDIYDTWLEEWIKKRNEGMV